MTKRVADFVTTVSDLLPVNREPGDVFPFPKDSTAELTRVVFSTNEEDMLKDSLTALDRLMAGKSYHVWYWYFHPVEVVEPQTTRLKSPKIAIRQA